jgi:4-hydroxybenzoate polyprenyltransferase
MRTIKNPMFMTSALFLIVGVMGLIFNVLTGVILLLIGLFTSVAGCLVNARRGRSQTETSTDSIRLQTPPL